MSDNRCIAGLNGFGRFGLNYLWWWWNDRNSPYRIAYIHDEKLKPEQILRIIKADPLVHGFRKCKVALTGNLLLLQDPDGRTEHIVVTEGPVEQVSWLGEPDIFLECSGRRSAAAELCRQFIVGSTAAVIVSATMYDADATLVMGFNHRDFKPGVHKVVSYGSCTVNPGITLSKFLNDAFGVKGCDVGVIHNVQQYRLESGEFYTLQRKFCTLEAMAPRLLPFFSVDNFKVKYTVVPWEGASMMDFGFRLKHPISREKLMDTLKDGMSHGGPLEGLFGMVAVDTGPEVHVGSPYSAVFVESEADVVGDTAHLFCYFYNEGSSIRMHELAGHIAGELHNS